jgi:A/G-specific adenine glycosylase
MDFTEALLVWYSKNKRDLPWRRTKDPYFIWLSEIILQQTRVDQGMNYYLAFCKAFPTIQKLAAAPEEKVIKLWQGLGYYSRARNLHATARHVVRNLNGQFPDTYEGIIQLKGIGPYTAAAIASISFNLPCAVVDGNVYRVLARVFGIESPIDSSQGKKEFQDLATELLDKKRPDLFNQAIMEFGATWCKPANPNCNNCIFSSICLAFRKKKINLLPVKEKTTKVRNRFFNYLVIHHGKTILIKKRIASDIWKNLYDFPLLETGSELTKTQLLKTKEWQNFLPDSNYIIHSVSKTYKHILSHQRIFARFWSIQVKKPLEISKKYKEVKKQGFHRYPIPKLVDLYVNDRQWQE